MKKKNMDLAALWKNSPIGLVNEVLLDGNLEAVTDSPIVEGEVVIGEMSQLEIAIYTAADRLMHNQNSALKAAWEKGEMPNMALLTQNKENHDALDELLWACISDRLGIQSSAQQATGIRDGNKIVAINADAEQGFGEHLIGADLGAMLAAASLMRALGAQNPGGSGPELGQHVLLELMGSKCAECPDYDKCDSPIKAPRPH